MTSKDIQKYILNNKLNTQEGMAAPFPLMFVYNEYMKMEKIYPLGFDCIIVVSKNGYLQQHLSQDRLDQMMTLLLEEYSHNQKKFQNRNREIKKIFKQLEYHCVKLNWDQLSQMDVPALWSKYEQFADLFRLFWQYVAMGEEKGLFVESQIVPQLAFDWNVSEKQARKFLAILSQPNFLSVIVQEQLDFWQTCLDYDQLGTKALKKYQKKYFWKKTDFQHQAEYSIQDLEKELKQRLKRKSKKQILQEIDRIQNSVQTLAKEKQKLVKKLRLSASQKTLIDFISMMGKMADQRKLPMMMGFYSLFKFLKLFAQKAGVAAEVAINLISMVELKKLVFQNKYDKSQINQRKKGFLAIFEKNQSPVLEYGKNVSIIENIINQKNLTSQLKGTVASTAGKKQIQGIVRVVTDPKATSFRKDEILVTGMTRPEFVPLMKKAAAIITNEGGITCHAAIISREMRIPCIIGTKNATTFLKTGQMVTLDLIHGTIK